MIELMARSAPARSVEWVAGDVKLRTPLVISSPAFPLNGLKWVDSPDGRSVQLEGKELFSFTFGLEIPLAQLEREGKGERRCGQGCAIVKGAVAELGEEEVVIMGGALELRRDARRFAHAIAAARTLAGPNRLLYVLGAMEPWNLALLIYAGADIVDTAAMEMQFALGRMPQAEGIFPAEGETLEKAASELRRELALIDRYLKGERLRELVEMRSPANPWGVAALRILDEELYSYQEGMLPVNGPRFYCNSKQSLSRPDIIRWRKRIAERYYRPAGKKVLLLLPCSAKKPYHQSKSHQAFLRALEGIPGRQMVHEVIVTSPLGIVPREVEMYYPAAQYDIPVTGHWDREEVHMVQEAVKVAAKHGYEKIVCHLGEESWMVQEVVDCIVTSEGSTTNSIALDDLRAGVASATRDLESTRDDWRVEAMRTMAEFQFGPGARSMLDGCRVSGSYPFWRFQEGNNTQLGMFTPDRGMISLTIDGAKKLAEMNRLVVRMGDFQLKGNLFAKGVISANEEIRPGDDVVIMRGTEVTGVGVASMTGREMTELQRGEAVRMRHKA
jgi:archaeosine synthase